MRSWLMSRNGAITFGIIVFLTLMARITFLDALYVTEFRTLLPENQPMIIVVVMLVYMFFVGGWVWSLLSAAQGNRIGLFVALLFSLSTAFGGGLFTLTTLCPNGCAAPPAGNLIVWANLVSGLAASLALGLQLGGRQSTFVHNRMGEEVA